MAIIAQGYTGVVEIPQSITYTPKGGYKTSRVWEGPTIYIQQMAASLVNEYGQTITITITPKSANLAKLTAVFDRLEGDEAPEAKADGGKEEETASWTLSGQNMELSLWTHPLVKDLATACPTEYSWLRTNLKIVQDKGTWTEVLAAYTDVTACAIKVKDVFKLFRDGVENYQHSAYVIRKSSTIRNDAEGIIATDNVNAIFTKAQLTAIEDMPNDIAFAVPDLQWLKGTPTIAYQNGKLTADNEWVGADEWSSFLYEDAV